MSANSGGCCGGGTPQGAANEKCAAAVAERATTNVPKLVDHKVTLLIAAGAAMAANCEACLNKIVPDLIEAGVCEADIRRAVEIGQFVKDKPADHMKEVADTLTGSKLARKKAIAEEGCPADKMKQQATCG